MKNVNLTQEQKDTLAILAAFVTQVQDEEALNKLSVRAFVALDRDYVALARKMNAVHLKNTEGGWECTLWGYHCRTHKIHHNERGNIPSLFDLVRVEA